MISAIEDWNGAADAVLQARWVADLPLIPRRVVAVLILQNGKKAAISAPLLLNGDEHHDDR
ncbi:hypothetical protein [Sphingobium sp. EM0848]|uniref:hypothetical protein n=1 Tax=Sphingobium sp. EM0848 TaxID=2743473 RepID=UPI00159C5784|nr:hypothetical protein [Sphingobium sp. EM0848]